MIVIVVSSLGLVKIGGKFDSFVPHIFEVFSLYYLSIIQTPEQLKEIKHSPSLYYNGILKLHSVHPKKRPPLRASNLRAPRKLHT
jgi:hypothetical protein